jgi:hypothetical protein
LGPAAAAVTLLGAAAAFGNNYFTLREDRSDLKHDVSQLENEAADVTPRLSRSERLNRDYADLVAFALQKGQLSQQAVRRFVPDRTDAGSLPAAIKITDPAENERVADGTFVRGRSDLKSVESRTCWKDGCSTALPRSHRTIWILTQPAGVNRYYPQGSSPDEAGPATVGAGYWVSPAVLFGPTPEGTGVLIHVVVADRDAEEAFKDYLRAGSSTKEFPGLTQGQLPKGARFRHSVRVTFRGAR